MKNTFDTKTVFVRTALAAVCLVFGSVAVSVLAGETRASTIETNLRNGPFPWTKTEADTSAGKFTFAVFSDLSGGEREGVFEVAIEQLNLLRPELIMNVGDLIDAGWVNTIYGKATGLDEDDDQRWHQNVSGVDGVAEQDDLFGCSLR
jgi:hypothetical protein